MTGIHHVGLSVSDLDRSVAFYRDLLGMDVVIAPVRFEGGPYETITGLPGAAGRVAFLRAGPTGIELFEFSHPPERATGRRTVSAHGITHVCVSVADIEAEYARLRAWGVEFHCAPLTFPSGAKATYGRDPDGNVFELREAAEERHGQA